VVGSCVCLQESKGKNGEEGINVNIKARVLTGPWAWEASWGEMMIRELSEWDKRADVLFYPDRSPQARRGGA
jgi:hypothetical protein